MTTTTLPHHPYLSSSPLPPFPSSLSDVLVACEIDSLREQHEGMVQTTETGTGGSDGETSDRLFNSLATLSSPPDVLLALVRKLASVSPSYSS
ncbi:hypothetical protein BDP27DRAFT_1424190 [Rhodocollybia butyracea]|uniref:Uncharacterized protein n=1 Tax=Rhodocollybia butyracea TaxID=206335 RepID=A0A9P5PMP9_9AGAR|nr:hypothetical protein BDP27DRAFT_1424190 [Rhodocollybia butyracea]